MKRNKCYIGIGNCVSFSITVCNIKSYQADLTIKTKGQYMVSWLLTGAPPPEQRYWQNRETANVGLDSSVGRAPARQSGGRRFKSRSSKFFFVHPNLSIICTQSVSLVVYYMIKLITNTLVGYWIEFRSYYKWFVYGSDGGFRWGVPMGGSDGGLQIDRVQIGSRYSIP